MRLYTAIITMGLLALLSSAAMAGEDGHAAAGPGYYVVEMTLTVDPATFESPDVLGAHVQHLISLYDQGALFMAGPFEDAANRGQIVLVAGSADEARQLVSADPSVEAGVMRIDNVYPWTTFFSRPDGRTVTMEQFGAMMASGEQPDTSATSSGASSSGGDHSEMDMTPGNIGFTEIPSTNIAESEAFYGGLFGWQIMPMPGMDGFAFFTTPGGTAGGFTTEAKPSTDGIVVYLNCDGVQSTLDRIAAAGGTAVFGPMALPDNMGHIAQFTDPHGNKLGLWSMAP